VSIFLAELYQGAAEPLPECALDTNWLDTDMAADWVTSLDPDLSSRAPLGLANLLLDVKGLPVRFLPPGRPRDIYWQFLCWCENLKSGMGGLSLVTSGVCPWLTTQLAILLQLLGAHFGALGMRSGGVS